MSLLVLLSRKVLYCTLRSWASQNKEPRLLSSRNLRTHTCNRERYAAALATGNSALACEEQTKVWRKLVSMRGAKLADPARHTRFVCAILGLSLKARIRGLCKEIPNPHFVPNYIYLLGAKCGFALS